MSELAKMPGFASSPPEPPGVPFQSAEGVWLIIDGHRVRGATVPERELAARAGLIVTDEMVERARKAFVRSAAPHFVGCSAKNMRAALEAALSPDGTA